MQSIYLPLIILFPLLGAFALFSLRHRLGRPAIAWLGSGAVFLAFLATLAALWQHVQGGEALTWALPAYHVGGAEFGFGFLGDAISLWFMLVVTGVGFLIHVYSAGYMAHEPDYGRYFAQLNYFIFAMSTLILADSFMFLAVGWANVGLASYMLIGFYFWRPAAAAAAMKAFVVNMFGEIFMFAGMGAVLLNYGSVHYYEVFEKVRDNPYPATLIGLLLLVGACAKSAQLPLHTWLPDAMQGPTPVSALIHAATMVTAGVYLVARAYPIYQASETALMAVAVVGALSALLGALIAARQYDIKKVLAFSTMSQIGYMFLGNGVGAHSAALFHFMTHAFFKALLFLTAGIIIHELAGEQDIRKMGGLRQKQPFAYAMFAIGALALIGLPPFAGFFSKDEILTAAFAGGHYFLWVIGLLAAATTAFYNTRLFALVFWGEPLTVTVKSGKKRSRQLAAAAAAQHDSAQHTPMTMKWPVAVLAALSAVGGLMAVPHAWNVPADFMHHYFGEFALAGAAGHAEPGWAILSGLIGLVLLLAAIGIYTALRLYGPGGTRREAEQKTYGEPAGVLGKGLYFDELYEAIAVQPARALAAWAGEYFDARVIDGVINGLAWLAGRVSDWFTFLQTGFLRRYALTVFAGLVAVVAYFMFYV